MATLSISARRLSLPLPALLLLLLLALQGCSSAASTSPSSPPPPPASKRASGDGAAKEAPAPSPAAEAAGQPTADARPGLATHWGETRTSHIRTTQFTRSDERNPSATAALWYNDARGARAMASTEGYASLDRASLSMLQGGVTVSLRDERGRTLNGYSAGGKTYAVGDAGARYVIVVTNHTPARFEALVTVDGLDVIDGRPGAFDKRGYLLHPHATLEIEGFRRSETEIATFRFGDVRGSYAARKGDDANVGVIGVAVFHERGVPVWPWDQAEIERRKNADPFPGRFATPPN